MLNTLKTTLGYAITLVSKYTPLKFDKNSLHGIYNYLPISDTLTTSGQPTEKQFAHIKTAGFTTVINLAPHDVENAIENEEQILNNLGINYIHIPVNFQKPSERKFSMFVEQIEKLGKEKVWLHCAANMRASAFLYRYRVEILGEDPTNAHKDMSKIWEPMGVWKSFVETKEATT